MDPWSSFSPSGSLTYSLSYSLSWGPFLASAAVVGLTILAALQDMAQFRISNAFPLAIIALFPIAVLTGQSPPGDIAEDVLVSVALAVAVFTVGAGLFFAGLWGGGDVKLLAALALWAHPNALLPFLVWVVLAGGVVGMVLILGRWLPRPIKQSHPIVERMFTNEKGRRQKIPYGLAIMIGVLLLWHNGGLGPPGYTL